MRGRDEETGEFFSESRSQNRREALEVLALGEKLVELTAAQLARLPIPADLLEHMANGREIVGFSPRAIALLQNHDWPGNIRELRNVVERAIIMLPGKTIEREGLERFFLERNVGPEDEGQAVETGLLEGAYASLKAARDAFEKEYILKKLRENGMNISRTAKILGIERSNLHRKINALGIECDNEG